MMNFKHGIFAQQSTEAKAMPNDEELNQNLFDIRNAVAQQRLEGLTPSIEVVSDLERAARGEIPVREVIDNIGKRYMDAQIRRQRPLS